MKCTNINPTEVAPSSLVLSQTFVTTLTVLTGSFYSEIIYNKKKPMYFKHVPKNFQISNVFKMPRLGPPELCNCCVQSAV